MGFFYCYFSTVSLEVKKISIPFLFLNQDLAAPTNVNYLLHIVIQTLHTNHP